MSERTSDSSQSAFHTFSEIGIELANNGHWFKLFPDGQGGTALGTGIDNAGPWNLNATTPQVRLVLMRGSGTVLLSVSPKISNSPLRMRLDDGTLQADYVRNDSLGRCQP